MYKIIITAILAMCLLGCKAKQEKQTVQLLPGEIQTSFNFDLQGHRGARGLYPENSLVAFEKAIELGVNTIELDVVVTKDNQILVSHDPFFNHIICLDSLGNTINKDNELNLNIYQTTYSQVQQYDCGSTKHPQFPEQTNSKLSKPLLLDVIAQSELLSDQKINYNIEIKSTPEGDNKYHPTPQVFADLFIKTIQGRIPMERLMIQSFDFRVLRYIHQAYPDYKLAALAYKDNVKTNLDALGFIPDSYSPEHTLLTAAIVTVLQAKGMKVIPWTINEASRMKTVLGWGVDGIITDYPDIGLLFKK